MLNVFRNITGVIHNALYTRQLGYSIELKYEIALKILHIKVL